MMEHIRQFDWCATSASTDYFVEESALDNSNMEKILKNRFRDPLLSSDEEQEPNNIDWNAVFQNKTKYIPKAFCPGLRAVQPYLKLSILTGTQHYQCLKVLNSKLTRVLDQIQLPRPTPMDRRCLEALTEIYQNEQKEYIEWAKSLWEPSHCIRALRPKEITENVYEVEFKLRAQRLSGYSKNFDMAAQIPLECKRGNDYDAVLVSTLIDVKTTDIPLVQYPELVKSVSIIKQNSLPEPCHKHPYRIVLPNEDSVSILPITEIHRELANFAAHNNSKYIASENALRCLTRFGRYWTIPITVCTAFTLNGDSINVVVLDSEFSVKKEPVTMRTYKAFRHLLEQELIPTEEIEKRIENFKKQSEKKKSNLETDTKRLSLNEPEFSSDDDEPLGLVIFEDNSEDGNDSYLDDDDKQKINIMEENKRHFEQVNCADDKAYTNEPMSVDAINDIIGVYNCTCTDTLYEVPPRRSFKKWRISDRTKNESHNLIVHCSHKARDNSSELVVEPIPEYQLDLGGSELPPDRVRSLALSLMLREKASALTVRIDGCGGEIVTYETIPAEQFLSEHKSELQQVVNIVHTTLSELDGLLPGHYVLQHEPNHGCNSFLLVARAQGDKLQVSCDVTQLLECDESKIARDPPTLIPVLLPYHKYRRILPCAFTPYENHVARESKKPAARQKIPPKAIKGNAATWKPLGPATAVLRGLLLAVAVTTSSAVLCCTY